MPEKKPLVKRVDDPIWKSILEQTFAHFLTFFFPDAKDVFDLEKKFEYLDKEFETLFPPEPNNKGVRYVDKLVKVHLLKGGEKFILCHIEVVRLVSRLFNCSILLRRRIMEPVFL